MRERSTTKRLMAALGAMALVCGSGFGARAQNLIYFKYTAIDSLSGNLITTVGSMTATPFSGFANSVTSLTGTRTDGDGVATLSFVGPGNYGDTLAGNLINDQLLYLSALNPPVPAIPPFDVDGITFIGTGTNGDGSSYLFDNLVQRTLVQLASYMTEPFSMVSPIGLYEDDYTAPILGGDTPFVLNPILSFDTSDQPIAAPAPVPGAGGLSFAAGLAMLIAAGARRVHSKSKPSR